jgi:hypothetical protein
VTVTRLLPRGVLEILGGSGIETVQADRVLLATGTRESSRSARLIGGTRPWGVLNTGALQQLVHLKGVRPFRRPIILGTELVSFSALLTLRRAGGRAVAMIEEEERIVAPRPADWIARFAFGTPVWLCTRLVAILGQDRVEAVEVEHEGRRQLVDCDGVVLAIERGLVFVPALVGLACPHWRRDAAGLWIGLTPATTGSDLLRAVVEGVALRAGEVLREIGRATGGLKEIVIDGGLASDAYLRHVLARIVDIKLVMSTEADATLVGIAVHAQRGAGFAEMLAPPQTRSIPSSMPLNEEASCRFAQAVACSQSWWR